MDIWRVCERVQRYKFMTVVTDRSYATIIPIIQTRIRRLYSDEQSAKRKQRAMNGTSPDLLPAEFV